MPKENNRKITYVQAIDEYYNGVHELNKQPIPFRCQKCGSTTYIKKHKDKRTGEITVSYLPVVSLADTFTHIRKNHKQPLKYDVPRHLQSTLSL